VADTALYAEAAKRKDRMDRATFDLEKTAAMLREIDELVKNTDIYSRTNSEIYSRTDMSIRPIEDREKTKFCRCIIV